MAYGNRLIGNKLIRRHRIMRKTYLDGLIKLIIAGAAMCMTLEACGSNKEAPEDSIWEDIEGKSADFNGHDTVGESAGFNDDDIEGESADSKTEDSEGKSDDSIWEEIGEESSSNPAEAESGSASASDRAETAQDSLQVNSIQVKVTPLEIEELIVSEALVIDDKDDDLLEAATGDEVDFPGEIKDEELPDFYVSDQVNNRDYITPVRNQGYTALCWNYSALGAIESDLLRHHNDLNVNNLNLSEKHGAYYNMHQTSGSALSGIDEDFREFVFDDSDEAWLREYDTNYISVGGVTDYCLSLYTAWKGPVIDEENDSFHVIKGQSEIYTQNADAPSGAYDKTFCHVQGVYEVPATAKNRDLIKKLIMEHGSVTASICSEDAFWTGKKVALYDYKKYGEGNYADHEILIVGWKDDYPAQNFITKAEEDGAFICKNSWGTGSGVNGYFYLSYDDNILCNNIVAAYDCSIPGDTDWYDNNYQYAGFVTHIMDPIDDQKNVVYMYDNNDARYAMRLSPEKDEVLSAIGYFSMTTGVTDHLAVYSLKNADIHSDIISGRGGYSDLMNQDTAVIDDNIIDNADEKVNNNNSDDKDNIGNDEERNDNKSFDHNDSLENNNNNSDDKDQSQMNFYMIDDLGEPLITMDCNYITGGYHTFSLDKTIDIHSDEEYLIVISPGKESKLIYEKEMDYITDRHYDDWKHNLGRIHTHNTASGNSFLESSEGNAFISQNDKDFFIKVYTRDTDE